MIIYLIFSFLIIFANFIFCKYPPEFIENENFNSSLLIRKKRKDTQICRHIQGTCLYEIFLIRDVYLDGVQTKNVAVYKSFYDK
jgi:hypothetical protein